MLRRLFLLLKTKIFRTLRTDCLREECAVKVLADYIVTGNPNDYMMSRIKVIKPSVDDVTALLPSAALS